jgi:hypothetical protein
MWESLRGYCFCVDCVDPNKRVAVFAHTVRLRLAFRLEYLTKGFIFCARRHINLQFRSCCAKETKLICASSV